MKRIKELSNQLESQSSLRIKEAERSDELKTTLRKRLNDYSVAEEDFSIKMKECEDALEATKKNKLFEEEKCTGVDKKKKRRNKKKKIANGDDLSEKTGPDEEANLTGSIDSGPSCEESEVTAALHTKNLINCVL